MSIVSITHNHYEMLKQYNVFFSITFHEVKDKDVYYMLHFGRINNNNLYETYKLHITFEDLRMLKINHKHFPSSTIFKRTNPEFINSRILDIRKWFDFILESNNGNLLFNNLHRIHKERIYS